MSYIAKNNSSSAIFAQWKGPAEKVEIKSPYSYVVEYNGSQYHLHANKLRKFHVRVDDVECNSTGYSTPEILEQTSSCSAIIYEQDIDFGEIAVVDPPSITHDELCLLPSQRIDPERLSHLSVTERNELLFVLDKYSDVF
jgi:hypothetical protein